MAQASCRAQSSSLWPKGLVGQVPWVGKNMALLARIADWRIRPPKAPYGRASILLTHAQA